jgi:hypothetical protein
VGGFMSHQGMGARSARRGSIGCRAWSGNVDGLTLRAAAEVTKPLQPQ